MPYNPRLQREEESHADLQVLARALERAAAALAAAALEAERAARLQVRSEALRSQSDAQLLTIGEAAKTLRLSRSKLYEFVLCGDIPSITLGRSRRIPATALADWVERQRGE